MEKIKGIFAASMSILDDNLTLNVNRTIKHAENLFEQEKAKLLLAKESSLFE